VKLGRKKEEEKGCNEMGQQKGEELYKKKPDSG